MTALLELHDIECRYQDHTAVHGLSLHVQPGELVCLLGPREFLGGMLLYALLNLCADLSLRHA